MGSACLFFALKPECAVLGDLNSELVDCFKCVQEHPLAISRELSRYTESKASYYRIRGLSIPSNEIVQRAARFIYLNRFCFNGLYRTNLRGTFNVPYAGYKTGKLPNYEQLKSASRLLKSADILNSDFEHTLKCVRKGDFVYLDPPFAVSNRRVFREYGPRTFERSDLERLAKSLRTMNSRGAHFLVSYAYCNEALALFEPWHVKVVMVQRNIAGFSTFRRKAAELVVTNIES